MAKKETPLPPEAVRLRDQFADYQAGYFHHPPGPTEVYACLRALKSAGFEIAQLKKLYDSRFLPAWKAVGTRVFDPTLSKEDLASLHRVWEAEKQALRVQTDELLHAFRGLAKEIAPRWERDLVLPSLILVAKACIASDSKAKLKVVHEKMAEIAGEPVRHPSRVLHDGRKNGYGAAIDRYFRKQKGVLEFISDAKALSAKRLKKSARVKNS